MNFQRRVLQTKFENWLREPVYTGAGLVVASRQSILYQFTLDLISFHKRFGYSITRPEKDVACELARFMFKTTLVPLSKLKFTKNKDERPEDFDMYIHRMGTEDWNRFFHEYSQMEDFDCSTANGRYITYSMPCFAWYNVNVNASEATRILDDQLASSDSEGEEAARARKKKNRVSDPYLTDQQNNVSKFNRWD